MSNTLLAAAVEAQLKTLKVHSPTRLRMYQHILLLLCKILTGLQTWPLLLPCFLCALLIEAKSSCQYRHVITTNKAYCAVCAAAASPVHMTHC
jgi:hypothetical protein